MTDTLNGKQIRSKCRRERPSFSTLLDARQKPFPIGRCSCLWYMCIHPVITEGKLTDMTLSLREWCNVAVPR